VKKLYQLKKWLTIEDTARHLSIVFDEPVSEADVLRLGLDGHLKLSINFINGAVARCGNVVTYDQAKMYILPRDTSKVTIEDLMPRYLNTVTIADELPEEIKKGLEDQTLCYAFAGLPIRDNEVLELEKEISRLSKLNGVYDLPMMGGERLDVEHKYQMLTDCVEVTGVFLDGAFVVSSDGKWCQLQEHFNDNPYSNSDEKKKERAKKPLYHPDNYYPAGGLPDDSVLAVRTSELTEFESRISESEGVIEKPLSTTERTTLLTVIAALCDYSEVKYQERGAAAQIARLTEASGAPVNEDTISKALKKIPSALEARMK
jgi:hypothetical protein